MSGEINGVLEAWRGELFDPDRGFAWVVRAAATRPWPDCSRCRRLGEVVWDTEAVSVSVDCPQCQGTGLVIDRVLRDYLDQHGAHWTWRAEGWYTHLRSVFEPMTLPGGLGEAWVSGQGELLWFRRGEAMDLELTLDRRSGELLRGPDLVLRWWPPFRATVATEIDDATITRYLALLGRINDAVFDQLRCSLSFGDAAAVAIAHRMSKPIEGPVR